MKGKTLLATLAVSAVLFAGCGLKQEAIITVNGTPITQAQFDKAFDKQVKSSAFGNLGVNIKENPNGFMYLMIKDRVINELIVKSLINEELAKRNITVTKDDVDNKVKEIIDKVSSKEQLSMLLRQNGISNAQFRKDLEEEVKMQKLADELGTSDVTEAEAKKFYKENLDKFKYPKRVRASHILISANPQEIEQSITSDVKNKDLKPEEIKAKVEEEIATKKTKAEELYNKIKFDPDNFAQYAKDNSDDTASAVKGGDLGFFSEQEMVPEFSKAAFTAKPNVVTPVVKSQFGYHIILVTDRMEAGQQSFEKVKVDIQNYLKNEKQLKLLNNLIESLKKNADIKYLNEEFSPEKTQGAIQKNVQDSLNKAKENQSDKTQK